MSTTTQTDSITYEFGIPTPISEAIWLVRLPLSESADHVNVYLLRDKNELMLVDSGTNTPACQAALKQALNSPLLNGCKVTRVLVTHHHPDHIGNASLFTQQGAQLISTRTCWLCSQLLYSQPAAPDDAAIDFLRRHAMSFIEIEAYRRRAPNARFRRLTSPMPESYRSLVEGSRIFAAGREWLVRLGNGHAVDHVTLWSEDLALVGDQILSGISASLSVHPSEPDADPIGEWFSSNNRFADLANEHIVALPGHGSLFTGIPNRCALQNVGHQAVLNRLLELLQRPYRTAECIEQIQLLNRPMGDRELAFFKAAAYLNHLVECKLVHRELVGKSYLWRAA